MHNRPFYGFIPQDQQSWRLEPQNRFESAQPFCKAIIQIVWNLQSSILKLVGLEEIARAPAKGASELSR